jgi:hypothetical protein
MKQFLLYIMIRVAIVVTMIVVILSGCTINRNAPLISSEIQINDSANNNEVPLLP